jgi:hypothetical protein
MFATKPGGAIRYPTLGQAPSAMPSAFERVRAAFQR